MSGRRIYVDIDDVLSATIESLIDLLDETHGRRVDVEEVTHFDLERSFGLDPGEIGGFMERAHSEPVLRSLEPKVGAATTLAGWSRRGHEIRLVTGRPPSTNAASCDWLAEHGFDFRDLHHLDKWNRPDWNPGGLPALRFDELPEMNFDLAVEDSLETACRLVEEFEIPVVLMDQPWNRDLTGLAERTRAGLIRCHDWNRVGEVAADLLRSA